MDSVSWMVLIFFATLIVCGDLESKRARVIVTWCIVTLLCGFLGAIVGFLFMYSSARDGGSFAALGKFFHWLIISSSLGLIVGLAVGGFAATRLVRWINRPR